MSHPGIIRYGRKYKVGSKSVQCGLMAIHPTRYIFDGKYIYYIKDSYDLRNLQNTPVIDAVKLRPDGTRPKTEFPKLHRFTKGTGLQYVREVSDWIDDG